MKRTAQKLNSQTQSHVQLSIPLYQKPFLEVKKKVRGKNRQGFEVLQEIVCPLFQTALDRGEIRSLEARVAIQEFLAFIQGAKNK